MRTSTIGLAAAVLLAVTGCGGGDEPAAKSTPSASASASPSTKESASCQPLAREFLDRYNTFQQRSDADTLYIDTLSAGLDELMDLVGRMESVCSPDLMEPASLANYQTSLAVASLTVCDSQPAKCKETQAEAGDQFTAAMDEVAKVDALLNPTA